MVAADIKPIRSLLCWRSFFIRSRTYGESPIITLLTSPEGRDTVVRISSILYHINLDSFTIWENLEDNDFSLFHL